MGRRAVICLGIDAPPEPGAPVVRYQAFAAGVARVHTDLEVLGADCDFLGWDREPPPDAPGSSPRHFGFKPACFAAAKARGYDQVLWVDASIRVLRDPAPLFAFIERTGYLLFEEHHSLGAFCADAALGPLGLTREEAMGMPSIWGSVMGLDLSRDPGAAFLDAWHDLARRGVFAGPKWSGVLGWPRTASDNPRVLGHRHDQTAASAVAIRLGMTRWFDRQTFETFFRNDRAAVRGYAGER